MNASAHMLWLLWRPENIMGSPEPEVTVSCQVGFENEPESSERVTMLLSTEVSLQPIF